MLKDYRKWSPVKAIIHNSGSHPLGYKEREVWWCSVGENIGFEEDGKNELFNRPVLILKIFSKELFWGDSTFYDQKARQVLFSVQS
jgi:hypothetical protein